MAHLLIQNLVGSVLAGELIYDEVDSRWLGLKPSAKSGVTAYFDRAGIQSILHEDGTQEVLRPGVPREEQTELAIPQGQVLLVRVKGGVSYRGGVIPPLPGVPAPEGYWLEPSPGSGIVLQIPMEEVEEVFGR